MFGGDSAELSRVIGRALREARGLQCARTGSEHLLLALASGAHPVADRLAAAGAGPAQLREVVRAAGSAGAGVAADSALLTGIGVDLQALFPADRFPVDRPPVREPLLPFGARRARRRWAAMNPPVGVDAQAAYEASLRLALARREREHRPEHLALVLVALDPGVAWVLHQASVEQAILLEALACAYPPPRRNCLLRVERGIGRGARARDLRRRYERTTGRTTTSPRSLDGLIDGAA